MCGDGRLGIEKRVDWGSPMTAARNITIVIHALHGGGAERVTAQLARHWAGCGHRVTVITLDQISTDQYPVPPTVRRVGLDRMRTSRHVGQAVTDNLGRLRALRRAVATSAPDCIVSATDRINVMTLLACRRLRLPIAITEHIDPRRQQMPAAWEWLRGRVYRRATDCIALTQDIADYIAGRWHVPRTTVIPNGVPVPAVEPLADATARMPIILAMGRLVRQKGFDLLIHAMARVAARRTQWQLRVLGDGPERRALEALVADYHLQDRVALPGWVDHPQAEMARAGLFVLSSRYEGFPVGLLEAMACGLPVIAFDCQSGPAEIIRPEVDGVLVPDGDIATLATRIHELSMDPERRDELGRNARSVTDRFSMAKFYARWDAVLQRLTD